MIKLMDDVCGVTGYETVRLKERIFLSGYYPQELEKNMNKEIDAEDRLIIRVCFTDKNDNYKYVFCLSPGLQVRVPEGMTRIEYVELLKFLDTVKRFDYCLELLKHNPDDEIS